MVNLIILIIKSSEQEMKKTLGISRNKIHLLADARRERRSASRPKAGAVGNRFSKERLVRGGEIEMTENIQNLKKPFIEELSSVSTMDNAKPQWMAHFEECQNLLKAVDELKREMVINQNKRLTCVKVSEQKGYEMKIYDCAKEATARIKRSEMILELLKRQEEHESPANAKICKSICFKLATDIQNATKELRGQQRSFVEQRKQFQATEKASFLQLAADHVLNQGYMLEGDLIEDEAMLQLQGRNEEIKKIVQSIFQLNQIYKQLNELVILQGSLLDRIDENIELSKQAISNGVVHLQKAEKHQKKTGRCACGTILVLLLGISILLIILCTRWFK